MTFGEAIKQRRIELGMTIEQVSNAIDQIGEGEGFLSIMSKTVMESLNL